MILKKKKFQTSIFHSAQFDTCPEAVHSHLSSIEILATGNLEAFEFDAIIPCEESSLEKFIDTINSECIKANVNAVSIELYINDRNAAYVKIFS